MPTITAADWQTFAAMLAILGVLGGAVVALQRLGLLRRTPVPAASPRAGAGPLADVPDRLDRHAERLARLEGAVAGLASREDIHSLRLMIEQQAGAFAGLKTAMERDARAVDQLGASITRIEDHLIGEARR